MKIVNENPYRWLGVYSNSPTRERVANHNRLKAFLKVGKAAQFPLDLPMLLPPINRTQEQVEQAVAKLILPKDQLRYAQFWFANATRFDNIACAKLTNGDVDGAISVWSKNDNASSLQNRIVCALVRGRYEEAISCAERLYTNFSSNFVKIVLGADSTTTSDDLAHDFLNILCEEVDTKLFLPYINLADWKQYVGSKSTQPLIDTITTAITTAKASRGKGSAARYNAGVKLMDNTKQPLAQLREFLSTGDLQYQMIADKLGLEILQCGIDYFNDSEEPDAARKAMVLQKYAQSTVVGKMAKDRCKENVDILNNIIANLPPMEVFAEDRAIREELRKYSDLPQNTENAILLLKSCASILLRIKEKLGKGNHSYLNLSTIVVNNALNSVIEEVNSVFGKGKNNFSSIKAVLIEAWRAILYMDKFDIKEDFKEIRYNENRQSLYSIIERAKGFESSFWSFRYEYGCGWCNELDVSDIDMRTDDEMFETCNLRIEYELYLKRFPEGKHAIQARKEIEKDEYKKCTTKQACMNFLAKYPSSKYIKSVKDKIQEIENREKKQNAAIQACAKFTEVIALYEREKNSSIDIQKCSVKAFELANTEEDFNRIVKVFGRYTQGGKLAQNKLNEIVSKRKKDKEKRQKAIKWMLIIGIPLAIIFIIYLIWGIRGLSVGCFIIAFLAFCAISGAMKEGEGGGCLVAIGVTFVFGLLGYGLSSIADETEKTNDAKDLYKQILSNPTSELCSKYMDNYGDTEKSSEVNTIWLNILIDNARKFNYKEYTQKDYANRSEENPLCALCNFAEKNSGTQYEKKAQICVSEICDSLYNVACKKNTLNSWETYRAVVPSENYYRDSEDRINKIENYNWNTEAKAWKQANAENTASSYEKYLGLYPQGQHHTQAEKRLVDMQVNSIYAGDHGELPAMEQTSYTESSASYVTISNNTSYTLTILYSGPSSKRLVIEPNGNGSLSLKSGSYTIAAYVSDASVRRFAGREILSGGSYNASYYISQSPY